MPGVSTAVQTGVPVLVLGPLLLACAALAGGRRVAGPAILVAAIAMPVLSIVVSAHVTAGAPSVVPLGNWLPPLGIAWRLDGPAAAMLGMTAIVMAAVMIFALAEGRLGTDHRSSATLWVLLFLLWSGLGTLFVTADIFNIYVALEVTGLAGVALIAITGTPAALTAQMRYLILATFGSLVYLMGVTFLYGHAGTLDLRLLADRIEPTDAPVVAALALITIGLMIKTAAWPFHFWLPPAHASAISPVSAVLSALVIKGSFIALARIWLEMVGPGVHAGGFALLGATGGVAVIWGSLLALAQTRLKMVIAYSTVAQVGYLFVALAIVGTAVDPENIALGWSAALIHAMGHGFAKAAMFLAAGALVVATGTDRLTALAGTARRVPMAVVAFAAAGLSIMGLPPSGGFLAKWMMLRAALAEAQWSWVAILIIGGFLSAAYIFKFLAISMREPAFPDKQPAVRRSPPLEWIALFLALVSVALGLLSSLPLALIEASPGIPFLEEAARGSDGV